MNIDIKELKKAMKNAIKIGGNYADILKPDGNTWLSSIVEECAVRNEPIESLIDKCEDIVELIIVWGFLSYRRGLQECMDKPEDDISYIL